MFDSPSCDLFVVVLTVQRLPNNLRRLYQKQIYVVSSFISCFEEICQPVSGAVSSCNRCCTSICSRPKHRWWKRLTLIFITFRVFDSFLIQWLWSLVFISRQAKWYRFSNWQSKLHQTMLQRFPFPSAVLTDWGVLSWVSLMRSQGARSCLQAGCSNVSPIAVRPSDDPPRPH